MKLSLVSGGVGVLWLVVCLPQQIMSLYVRNALGASPAVWGMLAGVMQAAGLINLVSIPLYARSSNRKMTWIWLTGMQRISAFVVAAGAFAAAAGAPRTSAVTITLIAGVSYTLLGSVAGTGWWAWMADLVPVKIRSEFFGRRSSIVQAVNVVSLISLTWALDHVSGEPRIFIFYGLLYTAAGLLGTLDVLLHLPIPDPGDPAAGRPKPGDLYLPWRDRRFRVFALAMGIGVLGVNFTGPFTAPFITGRDGLGAPNFWIGITAAISQGAWVLTASFWGQVMDRLGKLPVLVIGALFPLSWSAYLAVNPGNFMLVLPILSLAGGLLASAYFDGLPQIVNALSEKGSRTAYMAWYWTVFAAAGAAGPILGGFVIEAVNRAGYSGFRAVVVITLVLTVAGAALMTRLRLPEASVRQTLPAIVSPSVLRNYGWTGIIERPDHPKRVGRALRSLEGRSARIAIPVIHERLDDPDPDVREEAVRSLGRFGGPDDVPFLAERLQNRLSTVRTASARALGLIGHADAIPFLLKGLGDMSEDIREACAAALGRTGTAEAGEVLRSLLSGSDTERVKVAGAMALAQAGYVGAIEEIYHLRRYSGSRVFRRQLAVALADLIGYPGGFYRYLPGTADSVGASGTDRLFRRAGRQILRYTRREGRRADNKLDSESLVKLFAAARDRFESGDFGGTVSHLEALVLGLEPQAPASDRQEPGLRAPWAAGYRVVQLLCGDARKGVPLEQEDILLIVWFLIRFTGFPV
jgi:HEAT repeat protein/Na+/melibiose symporter-like transporter